MKNVIVFFLLLWMVKPKGNQILKTSDLINYFRMKGWNVNTENYSKILLKANYYLSVGYERNDAIELATIEHERV